MVRPPGGGSQEVWLPWHNDGRAAIKSSADDSEGRLGQVEFVDGRGTSPPLHAHHDGDETFFVIDGELELVIDGRRMQVAAGDYVLIPRGQPHSYLVTSERAHLLATYAPAGMEQFFAANGIPIVPGQPAPTAGRPDPDEFAREAERYACEIVGPPMELP